MVLQPSQQNPSEQKMDERASGSRLDFGLRRKPVASDLHILHFYLSGVSLSNLSE